MRRPITKPVQMETLFWTFTLLPMMVPPATLTFWPKTQRSPILAPFMMWLKCQILLSDPISAPSSTTAVG